MNRIFKTAFSALMGIVAIGCARQAPIGANEANIRYFESWMQVNYPEAKPSGLGIYVLEEEEGSGMVVQKEGFVYADYIVTDLEGNISSYTDEETSKRMGTYSKANYYGPKVINTITNSIQAGLADAIVGMQVGGRKKVIIPGWLMTYYSYNDPEDYIKNASSGNNTIYDITIRDFTDSIQLYELSQIDRYIKTNPQIFDGRMTNDTTGFYYQPLSENLKGEEYPKDRDTTLYVNYTGRLLNGLVFDTTDERIAKDNGIYSASRSYEPVLINRGKKWSELTMGTDGSSTIPGFALTIWQMNPDEKGLGIFYSPLGYSYSGSGASIPGYAPLIFEIEIVDKPKN